MCKIGDIILINKFIGEDNIDISKHSFVVIEEDRGQIKGVDYDFVATIMSSIKNEEHKKKILSYKVNKLINNDHIKGDFKLKKESYLKTNKLYYFNKKNIEYMILARITDEYLNDLINIIISLSKKDKLAIITTNL